MYTNLSNGINAVANEQKPNNRWFLMIKQTMMKRAMRKYFHTHENDYPWRVPRLRRAGI